jgi:UDP:flavonoid glycosyltransferase YjiC (YdhE family)
VRILVASTAGAGHFNPLVPLLEAFGRRGDDVCIVGPPSLEAAAAATSHRFRAGAEPPADEQAAVWERFTTASGAETSGLIDRELFGRLCTEAMLPAMEKVCDEWRPHLVVRETCEYASAVVAERSGIPHAQVAISLAAVEASVVPLVAPVLQRHVEGMATALLRAPYLSPFPESLDPSPYARTRRWRASAAAGRHELPDWWRGSRAPLVYVTFGSVTGGLPIAASTFRAAIEAVAALPARVLVTIGRAADPASLGRLPENVHVEAWVPQADVLATAAAVVCHGGSGTTLGALSAGVPLVVVPLFADQPANGRLVTAAGAGVVLQPGRDPAGAMAVLRSEEAAELRALVERVLGEPSYSEAARRIADEMGAVPTVDELIGDIATELLAPPRGGGSSPGAESP